MPAPLVRSHVGSISLNGDDPTRFSPSLPAAVSAGDVLVIFLNNSGTAQGLAGPSGWTNQAQFTESGALTTSIWTKTAVGNEGGTTVTFIATTSSGGAVGWAASAQSISGAKTNGFVVSAVGGVYGSDAVIPTLTTLSDNSLVIGFAAEVDQATKEPFTVTGWTKDDELSSTNSGHVAEVVTAHKTQVTAGATGTSTWTASGATVFASYSTWAFALQEGAANQLPTANAGPNQVVHPGVLVTLSGSGTDADGTIASYAWTVLGQNASDITLSSATAQNPTFTAPSKSGMVYSFGLVVTDNSGGASSQAVTTVSILQTVPGTDTVGVQARASGTFAAKTMRVRKAGSFVNVNQ